LAEKDLTDEELVTKKEADINKINRKRDIRDAVNGDIDRSDLTDKERLRRVERDSNERNITVDTLATEELRLARRIVTIGRDLNKAESDLIEIQRELTIIKDKAEDVKKEADKYETREDKKFEVRRDTILRILAFGVPALIAIIGFLLYYKRV
jgi:hypothetical protein